MSTHHGILVHVVFSTKCRVALLADSWRDDLFAYIGGTVKEHKAVLLKAGGIEDHVRSRTSICRCCDSTRSTSTSDTFSMRRF